MTKHANGAAGSSCPIFRVARGRDPDLSQMTNTASESAPNSGAKASRKKPAAGGVTRGANQRPARADQNIAVSKWN